MASLAGTATTQNQKGKTAVLAPASPEQQKAFERRRLKEVMFPGETSVRQGKVLARSGQENAARKRLQIGRTVR